MTCRSRTNLSFTLSKRTAESRHPCRSNLYVHGLTSTASSAACRTTDRSRARCMASEPFPQTTAPSTGLSCERSHGRGDAWLWGDATNVAAQNIADIDSLEQQIANSFDLRGRSRAAQLIMATRSRGGLPDLARRRRGSELPDQLPHQLHSAGVRRLLGPHGTRPDRATAVLEGRDDHVRVDARRLRGGRPTGVFDRPGLGGVPRGVRSLRHQEQPDPRASPSEFSRHPLQEPAPPLRLEQPPSKGRVLRQMFEGVPAGGGRGWLREEASSLNWIAVTSPFRAIYEGIDLADHMPWRRS